MTWTCDHLKTSWSADSVKKSHLNEMFASAVMWLWSVDTLFQQMSTDYNMDRTMKKQWMNYKYRLPTK